MKVVSGSEVESEVEESNDCSDMRYENATLKIENHVLKLSIKYPD